MHIYICIAQSRHFIFTDSLSQAEDGGASNGGTLISRSVLFLSFPSYMFFGQKSGPNRQPQGTMWMDLVAQVLPLIQVSIHPRHRLYPASLCEDMQQEVPSCYPPLQLWVKSTQGCNKVNY